MVLFLGALLVGVTAAKHWEDDDDDDSVNAAHSFEEDDDNDNDDDNENDNDVETHDLDEDEQPAAKSTQVFSHLKALDASIQASHLSASARHAALDNLHHIERDAREMQTTAQGAHQNHLKEAMRLRMQALKLQVAQGDDTTIKGNDEDENDKTRNNDEDEDDQAKPRYRPVQAGFGQIDRLSIPRFGSAKL